jgi:nucleotide-binding universal stress UspA family protein
MANQNPYLDPGPSPTVGAGAVVLVGIDGSETSWDAFSWACGEARRLRGRVVAVFVSSSASSGIPASCYLGVGPFGFDGNDSTSTGRADALRRELECYAADCDVDLTFVHTDGDAASELLRLASELHADQIVVGRSMKARHHVAGSLAGRLVGKRKAPVVVVVP